MRWGDCLQHAKKMAKQIMEALNLVLVSSEGWNRDIVLFGQLKNLFG